MPANDQVVARILRERGVKTPRLLGEGWESLVFAYDAGRVIKVYKQTTLEYLRCTQALQATLTSYHLPFATPEIMEIHQVHDVFHTVDKMLDGQRLDDRLATLSERDALKGLAAYFDALQALHTVEMPSEPYGQLLPSDDRNRAETWSAFLLGKLEQRAKVSWSWLEQDVPHLAETLRGLEKLILDMSGEPRKAIVHGDYSQYNVLTNDRLEVSAVLDFSVYTANGDLDLDFACATNFPELSRAMGPSYSRFPRGRATRTYGKDIEDAIRPYRLL